MYELIAQNQKGKPGYETWTDNRVVTVAELLRDTGYLLTYLVNGTSQGIILRMEHGHMTEDLKKALPCLTVGLITLRVVQSYR